MKKSPAKAIHVYSCCLRARMPEAVEKTSRRIMKCGRHAENEIFHHALHVMPRQNAMSNPMRKRS